MSNLEKIRQLQKEYRNMPKLEKVIFHDVTNIVYVSTK